MIKATISLVDDIRYYGQPVLTPCSHYQIEKIYFFQVYIKKELYVFVILLLSKVRVK